MFLRNLLILFLFSISFSDEAWLQTYWETVPEWNGYDSLLITEVDIYKVKDGDTSIISGTDSMVAVPVGVFCY